MSYKIRLRQDYGLDPVVRSSSGTPRPLMAKPWRWSIIHHTGVNVRWGDVGDTDAEILGIERWALSVGKPNEYNVVVHQDPDDVVHQYAGEYRAAHSAGESSTGNGTLLLNGIHEPITPLQADKIKWLHQLWRFTGHFVDGHTRLIPHRDAPGAATACPGDQNAAVVPYLGLPPTFPGQVQLPLPTPEPKPPVVPVPTPDSSGVGHYLVVPGRTVWGISAEVYGTGTRFEEILDANSPDATPNPGERWKVPGFQGQWHDVEAGQGPWSILNEIFGSDGWDHTTGVDQFWQWNGGDPATGLRGPLVPGERVWVRS